MLQCTIAERCQCLAVLAYISETQKSRSKNIVAPPSGLVRISGMNYHVGGNFDRLLYNREIPEQVLGDKIRKIRGHELESDGSIELEDEEVGINSMIPPQGHNVLLGVTPSGLRQSGSQTNIPSRIRG